MSNNRKIPYVEILVKPRRKTPPSEHSRSSSPTIEPSPKLYPRKKRKFSDDHLSDDDMPNMLSEIKVKRRKLLSPTVSDYDIDEENPLPSSSSRTPLQQETDLECPLESFIYTVEEDIVVEDEDTVIHGETPLDDDERDAGDIPVRRLDDFVIYDIESYEAVPLACLLEVSFSSRKFSASGFVKPWIEQDSEDESDSDSDSGDEFGGIFFDPKCEKYSLSRIREFSIHSPGDYKGELDSKIYIKTKFAWYILGSPSIQYRLFFRPFWIKHRLLHLLVVASDKNSRLTYKEFKETVQDLDEAEVNVTPSSFILGRNLTESDLDSPDVLAYIVPTLHELLYGGAIQISRVPAIREILGPMHYDDDAPRKEQSRPRNRNSKSEGGPSAKKTIALGKTYLTPVVNRIAKNLFKGSLEVAQSDLYDDDHDTVLVATRDYKGHHTNPKKIVWGDRLVDDEDIYDSVTVDGVTYCVGDIVMVEPDGEDRSQKCLPASQTVNKYGNRWWFCQIRYFYREEHPDRVSKMFHGQWFTHGCKTILQETSHSKALYLLKKSCDNNPISSIFKKCNVTILEHVDAEVVDDGDHDANDFHCGLMYDEDLTSFEDLPPEALTIDEDMEPKSCYSCTLKEEEDSKNGVRLSEDEDEVVVYGETYHVHDFVYLHPRRESIVLDVGQIMQVTGYNKAITVQVRYMGRYDDYVLEQRKNCPSMSDLVFDHHRLFFTDKIEFVPAHKIEGKCQVRHLTDEAKIEEWIEHDDHFYINQEGDVNDLRPLKKRDFGYCGECRAEDDRAREQKERFMEMNSKLVGMELFSGAGGLGVGMNLSKFVETKYAIEYEPSAAKTYQRNHPETIVYCQDTSKLLKHAVAVMNNDNPPPILSNDGKTYCSPMPKKGNQIDFIFGGPPCQSFSKANHSKRHDDIRSTIPCNMLSYVEHYEPNYFLLENVAGFLDHKFYNNRMTPSGGVIEIQFGMVKFVTRALIALGYQVRYRLLQSGQYGVPQSRRRVIFWGAKRGIPLPEFPIPVYAFSPKAGQLGVSLPTGGRLDPITRSRDRSDYHFFAPLRPVSVDDAVSDLPHFEWKNPHLIIPARPKDRTESRRRQNVLDIAQFDADVQRGEQEFENLPGFPLGVGYSKEPQNRYQKWLRRGMTRDDEDDEERTVNKKLITGHYTRRWGSKVIEATANVPLRPLADHRDLDDIFLPGRAQGNKRTNKFVLYGRLDPNGHFRCAVTTLSPVVKNQWPLHPCLKRVISVREAARAQGFPDDYIFESIKTGAGPIVTDQLRQIGNAVSVPFALALGKELGKAMVKDWEKKEREGSVAL